MVTPRGELSYRIPVQLVLEDEWLDAAMEERLSGDGLNLA